MSPNSRYNSFLRRSCLILMVWWFATHAAASEPQERRELFAQPGSVIPAQLVRVTPTVRGLVTKVRVDLGDVVKAGEILAELDASRAKLEYEMAQAKVELARVLYQEMKAAVAEKASKAGLTEKDQPSPGKVRLRAAEAEIKRAEAELRLAKYDLDSRQIRAPSDGTVLAKHVGVGELLNPLEPKGARAAVFDLADLRRLEVVVEVPDRNLSQVFQGQRCRIEADGVPNMVYQGKVARVSPIADAATRCFRTYIEIQLPEKDNRILPWMYTRVGFLTKE